MMKFYVEPRNLKLRGRKNFLELLFEKAKSK